MKLFVSKREEIFLIADITEIFLCLLAAENPLGEFLRF